MLEIQEFFEGLLGLGAEPKSISIAQMMARAVFIFGSLLSRAINGAAPFSETIAAALTLLTLHWVFLVVAFHSDRLDRVINGEVRGLIRDGEVDKEQMRKARLSPRILRENLRLNGGVSDPSEVREADFEPSGTVSVIPVEPDREPRVVDVQVRAGVQTVRIEIA